MKISGLSVIERSLNGYPGRISTILKPDGVKKCKFCGCGAVTPNIDFELIKKNLLEDNPMVTAIMLEGCEFLNNKDLLTEIASWSKNNNVKVGLNQCGTNSGDLKHALKNELLDFVRIELDVSDWHKYVDLLKKSVGLIRASGVDYEFCVNLSKKQFKIAELEKIYKMVSPCRVFAICGQGLKSSESEELFNFAQKNKNVILRLWG
jgi:hypothetical protein